MAKSKDKPLKIDIPEDAALRAILQTPPPSRQLREMTQKLSDTSRKLMEHSREIKDYLQKKKATKKRK